MTASRPVVLLKPEPQTASRIFTSVARARLEASFEVVDLEGVDNASAIDEALVDAFAVVGGFGGEVEGKVRVEFGLRRGHGSGDEAARGEAAVFKPGGFAFHRRRVVLGQWWVRP